MSTAEDLRDWVRGHLGRLLGMAPEAIALDRKLSDYGLDSVDGILMAGELEDRFSVEVDPAIFLQCPNFEAMVVDVANLMEAKR
ncbi:MAG: acyl carrier protein [Steroidobacteraceae bacterium]